MAKYSPDREDSREIAARWCRDRGNTWTLVDRLGVGGTAPVFEVHSPDGPRALKIYDAKFSSGELGDIEYRRIQQQLTLRGHDCPSLVQVYDGGIFADRLYLLMSRAAGQELATRLRDIPRSSIRSIVRQVAQACLFLRSRDLCHRDIKAENVFISDDFARATLLDISVIRGIHDPVGAGTDHDGQLPVLATARYSPPEYLFRLIEPSPALWHALTVYQLGALLHDLIVRLPLFQKEYEQSQTNRYRFAWVVATTIPQISASDVDDDLLFIANRALDKDWKRRSALRIEDFLHDATRRQEHAFQVLGVFRHSPGPPRPDNQEARSRLDRVAISLEEHLTGYLRKGGVTTTHRVSPGLMGDNSRAILLQWDVSDSLAATATIVFHLTLRLLIDGVGRRFSAVAVLSKTVDDKTKKATRELPDVPDDEAVEATLASQAEAVLATLATELTSADNETN